MTGRGIAPAGGCGVVTPSVGMPELEVTGPATRQGRLDGPQVRNKKIRLCPSIEPVPPVGGIICSFVYWQLGAVNGPERARLAS